MDSEQLLRNYAEKCSESAFTQLVNRHISLVYATALRVVGGEAHLAQDVTQTVFADLARNARGQAGPKIVAGWLYRHTYFTASKAVRRDRRRQARERQAIDMKDQHDINEARFDAEKLAAVLDEEINSLDEGNRNALVLRFFENRDLQEVGATLGISADAAQKRISRAVDILRERLARRGIALPGTALATALASGTLATAPVGFAGNVSTAALARSTAETKADLTLLESMKTIELKPLLAASAMVLVGAIAFYLQHRSINRLQGEISSLKAISLEVGKLRHENARLGQLQIDANELERLRKEHLELLRLRGEIGLLRRQLAQPLAALAQENAVTNSLPAVIAIETRFAEMSPAVLTKLMPGGDAKAGFSSVLTEAKGRMLISALESTQGVDMLKPPKVVTTDGRETQISLQNEQIIGGETRFLGPSVTLLPNCSAAQSSITLKVLAECEQLIETDQPGFKKFSETAQAVLSDGETLVLGGRSKVSSVIATAEDSKVMLVLVTPYVIDPAGNRIKPVADAEPGVTSAQLDTSSP